MEPQIQYAKTSDGVSIAYCTLGEGSPFIQMTTGSSHLQLEWHYSGIRTWYERLAEKRMLVRYDGRGTGLSERDVTDYSLDARVRDFEAVVEHLGLDRFALWGAFDWGPVAVAYAVRHPQRVSHLILWCTYASTSDPAWAKTLDDLIMTDWEMATETMARGYLGRTEEEEAHGLAALVREAITPEAFVAITRAADQFDVTDLLGRVRSPTLVMHRRQLQFTEVSSARNLASRIPDARLVVLEGETPMPFMEDTDAVLQAIDEFLGEGEDAAPQAEPAEPGAFRTILFTDVEGSTAFTERLGDAKARELLREHEGVVREALKTHGGSEVKTMGDGFMTSFSSATRALECAIAIQSAFAQRNESAAEPIKVRIGLNAGEPIAEDDDLYGTAVNLAARIAAQAKGGEILASEAVRQIVAGKKFPFSDRGETTLRGFEDRVHIYQVSWREE